MTMSLASHDADVDGNSIPWPKRQKCHVASHQNGVLMMLLASCDTDTSINGITWLQMLCCTSFWISWLKIVLVKLTMSLASHNADVDGSSIKTKKIMSHLIKMVLLMTLLASCNTDTSVNGITWPEKLCCTWFQLSCNNAYSGAIDNAFGIIIMLMPVPTVKCMKRSCYILFQSFWTNKMQWWYWWYHLCHVMQTLTSHDQKPKKPCSTLFQSSWPRKNSAINKAISVMWCLHWCQEHHITKRVMSQLVIIILTKQTQWYH